MVSKNNFQLSSKYSHVLKEQSNVSRHHPDICLLNNLTTTMSESINSTESKNIFINLLKTNAKEQELFSNATHIVNSLIRQNSIVSEQNNIQILNVTSTNSKNKNLRNTNVNDTRNTINDLKNPEIIEPKSTITTRKTRNVDWIESDRTGISVNDGGSVVIDSENISPDSNDNSTTTTETFFMTNNNNYTNNDPVQGIEMKAEEKTIFNLNEKFCLDPLPLFVAQSSICWYVLSIGLSCYLTDLLLRRKRRSKTCIELLNVRLDGEGNLVELILNNNHRRFAYWLPGQFVYLNCPQIAQYEWHPFTISSMDNKSRQFTLHIKTGGDWTRKLRETLECKLTNNNSTSFYGGYNKNNSNDNFTNNLCVLNNPILSSIKFNDKVEQKPEIECTKLVKIRYDENELYTFTPGNYHNCDSVKIELDNKVIRKQDFCPCCKKQDVVITNNMNICCCSFTEVSSLKTLDLFIDGPFHSPFERLLEQEISICIANGVGWTAFSSVFHCIINDTISNKNNKFSNDKQKDWWYKWSNFAIRQTTTSNNLKDRKDLKMQDSDMVTNENITKNYFPRTKLHLMVIVTSIEQLKPFYYLAVNYFKRIVQEEINNKTYINADQILNENPVKEITAFITRGKYNKRRIH